VRLREFGLICMEVGSPLGVVASTLARAACRRPAAGRHPGSRSALQGRQPTPGQAQEGGARQAQGSGRGGARQGQSAQHAPPELQPRHAVGRPAVRGAGRRRARLQLALTARGAALACGRAAAGWGACSRQWVADSQRLTALPRPVDLPTPAFEDKTPCARLTLATARPTSRSKAGEKERKAPRPKKVKEPKLRLPRAARAGSRSPLDWIEDRDGHVSGQREVQGRRGRGGSGRGVAPAAGWRRCRARAQCMWVPTGRTHADCPPPPPGKPPRAAPPSALPPCRPAQPPARWRPRRRARRWPS
jgi:hypothetical protein